MKNAWIILKSIVLFATFLCGLSLPCMADNDKKSDTTPPSTNPIILEGKFEDHRERSLLYPVEAWTNGSELEVVFYSAVSSVTLTITGPLGVVDNRTLSFGDNQTETISLTSYASGIYTLVITTPAGTYLTGTFEVE